MRQIRRNWWLIWEDLHPLARGAVLIVLSMLGFTVGLWLLAWLGPRMMSLDTFFKLRILENIWSLANLVLGFIMVYTLLRLSWLVFRKQAILLNVVVVCGGLVVVGLWLIFRPSMFEGAVRHQTGYPYNTVFDAFANMCDDWAAEETININLDETELGVLSKFTPWRESNTVFFDFGDEEQSFGLACVLNENTPYKTGRLSRNFEYEHIRSRYYTFSAKDESSS